MNSTTLIRGKRMGKVIFRSLLMISVLLNSIQCTRSQQNRSKAVELNNQAVEFQHLGQEDKAMEYYDKAIKADETYYMPHANKVEIYLSRNEYEKALSESEIVIKKKTDLAEGWFFAGLLHDYLGNSKKAQSYYLHSVKIYDQRISNTDEEDKIVANKLNRAIALIFILGREGEGKAELEKLKESESISNDFIDYFMQISKEDLMNDLIESE